MLVLLVLPPGAGHADDPPVTEVVESAMAAQRACDAAMTKAAGAILADGVACFAGSITRASADAFMALPVPDGAWLALRSNGGDVEAALDMADRILERRLAVVVAHPCLSSCANYPFVAGAAKVVLPGGFVGWHGGPPRSPSPNLTERGREVHARTLAHQDDFYRRAGVDGSLPYLARPGSGVTAANRATRFWTWDAEELRVRFGVVGIAWMWVPRPPAPAELAVPGAATR